MNVHAIRFDMCRQSHLLHQCRYCLYDAVALGTHGSVVDVMRRTCVLAYVQSAGDFSRLCFHRWVASIGSVRYRTSFVRSLVDHASRFFFDLTG